MSEIIRTPHQRAQGYVQCFVVDAATGTVVKEYPRQPNLILNQGLDRLAVSLWADLFAYCSGGTGTTPTSDSGGITNATQIGGTVTLSGGSFTFTDTATDAGNTIKWDTGEEAQITSVTNPTTVLVNTSASVGAGTFTVYRTNQTQLSTQAKRTNTYLTGTPYCGSSLAGNVLSMRRTYDFTAEVGTVNYTEVAVGWSSSGLTSIFSRILLSVPVSVTAGQQLRVTYQLQVTILPSTSFSKTAIINGWPVAPAVSTNGVEAVQFLGLSQVNTSGGTTTIDAGNTASEPSVTGGIGVFLSPDATAPAAFGSSVNRSVGYAMNGAGVAGYIAGTYYVDKSTTFPVGSGNGAAWRSMGFGSHNPNLWFAWSATTMVFVFTEAQTKLNTHTLTLTWRFSWSRVLS